MVNNLFVVLSGAVAEEVCREAAGGNGTQRKPKLLNIRERDIHPVAKELIDRKLSDVHRVNEHPNILQVNIKDPMTLIEVIEVLPEIPGVVKVGTHLEDCICV